jgi:signal transduction histidine kinase
VVLIIEDNGKGMDENFSGSGHGFTNIRSRLDVVNGTFNLEPSFSAGTVATIRVSLL